MKKLDGWLSESKFLAGSSPTIADLACYCELDQLKLFELFDISSYPSITSWMLEMEKLPGYNESHIGLMKFHSIFSGKSNL